METPQKMQESGIERYEYGIYICIRRRMLDQFDKTTYCDTLSHSLDFPNLTTH